MAEEVHIQGMPVGRVLLYPSYPEYAEEPTSFYFPTFEDACAFLAHHVDPEGNDYDYAPPIHEEEFAGICKDTKTILAKYSLTLH